MAQLFSNNAASILAVALTSGGTSATITTGNGALFPTLAGVDFNIATIQSGTTVEVVKCTARAGDVFTITRGQEGTAASAFPIGAKFELRVTKGTLEGFAQWGTSTLLPYVIGDLLYAASTSALAKLADVSAGSYLRSGGIGVAPLWSTLKIPNTAATGTILAASSTDTISALAVGTAQQRLTFVGGVPVWESYIGARVTHNTTQTFTTGTEAALLFNTETFDTSAIHDTGSNTSRLTAPLTGKYLVEGSISWAANGTGVRVNRIRRNGSTILSGGGGSAIATSGLSLCHSATIALLNATDYVELLGFQSSGGNLDTITNEANFSMTWLGP
jgi:hypothetical protein